MHIILLNSVAGRGSSPTKIHELHFDARAQDESATNSIDLVVVDARGMDAAALNAAIVWVARTRNTQPVRKAIMVCEKPPIEFVVRAIRAGINDIFERPLTGRQIFLLLSREQPNGATRKAARAILQCGRLLAGMELVESSAVAPNLFDRERRVEELEKQLAAESTRLEQLRETLHIREADMLTRARRLDEEFARLQTDADLIPVAPAVAAGASGAVPSGNSDDHERLKAAEAQLRERAAQLDNRETALATRERMLREFEAMLLSQSQAVSS